MRRTRVKICGITSPEDALAAADAGADAIGLVFYADSPRHVTPERAAEICRVLPPFVMPVGLFVDAAPAEIERVLAAVPLGLLQFHGEESPSACARYARPYLKAVRMRDGVDVAAEMARFGSAAGILLDAYNRAVAGGTGEVFDWERVPKELGRRVILAGGLHPDNVAEAVAALRPYAVDVSSGVESEPGAKDAGRIVRFIEAVAAADRPERA